MKKRLLFLPLVILLLSSCSQKHDKIDNIPDEDNIGSQEDMENIPKEIVSADGQLIDDKIQNDANLQSDLDELSNTDLQNDSDELKNTNTQDNLEEDQDNSTEEANNMDNNHDNSTDLTVVDTIPAEYLTQLPENSGTIEKISYQTKDYFGDGSEITKSAYVYLPYNYDKAKQYNVLYLMHGIGGDINEWGMNSDTSRVKIMMDNLINKEEIEPFIGITPNGRSSADFSSSSDFKSFYLFGQELRNDLIPYIVSNYSTYAEYNENGYDLTKSRDHRAMAGLSMGGMQTINIGIGECLDILSHYGAFSAAPTSNPASVTASKLKGFTEYDISFFYNICGTEDNVAIAAASAAVETLTDLTDTLKEGKNFIWQKVPGEHNFDVWYLGFFNFANLVFNNYK